MKTRLQNQIDALTDEEAKPQPLIDVWRTLVKTLLYRSVIRAGGVHFRILETELYTHSAQHPDPFTHQHAKQLTAGQWYFHRVGKGYRGGSFKGLDLTWGNENRAAGCLIRTLLRDDGCVVCGPSRCVDAILEAAQYSNVRALDAAAPSAFQHSSALLIENAEFPDTALFACARVGLPDRPDTERVHAAFRFRPYRFLIHPQQIQKGRTQLICALLCQGHRTSEIARLVGSRAHHIERLRRARQMERPCTSTSGTMVQAHRLWERLNPTWTPYFGEQAKAEPGLTCGDAFRTTPT